MGHSLVERKIGIRSWPRFQVLATLRLTGDAVHMPMGPDITVSFPAAALWERVGQQDPFSFQPNRKTEEEPKTKAEEEALKEEDWLRQKVAEARRKRKKQVRSAVSSESNLKPLSCLSTCQIYESSNHSPLPTDLGSLKLAISIMVWVLAFALLVFFCLASHQCQA